MKILFLCLLLSFQMMTGQENFSVFFDSDQHKLTSKEQLKLNEFIEENKNSKILAINGFTDEDGGIEYNETLSMKRVQTVFDIIQNKIKIRDDFKKEHFGKLHQHSKNKAENRRVTIFYLSKENLHEEEKLIPNLATKKEKTEKINFPKQIFIANPDGSETEMNLDVAFMESIASANIGEKILMKDLNFVLNTFAVVNESRPRMFELLMVMQQMPSLMIEIEGHVCCTPKDRTDLSTQRAKAIKNFLIQFGISPNRVTFKGYGSTQPKFPIPEKNEDEKAANRRVEINVISK